LAQRGRAGEPAQAAHELGNDVGGRGDGAVGTGPCASEREGETTLGGRDGGPPGRENRPIFLYFVPLSKKNSRLDLKKFNVIFGPVARRHSLWRRGNTSLGAIAYDAEVRAALAQPGRRVADVAPSSAPRSMAPSSDV
jgi:hypothetical protein